MNEEYSAPIELPEDDLAPTEPTFYSESGEYLTFSELLPSNATTANELFTRYVRDALEQVYMQQGEAEYTRYEQQLIDRARATKGVSVGDIRALLKPVLKDLKRAKKQVDAERAAEDREKRIKKATAECAYPDYKVNRFGDITLLSTSANFDVMCAKYGIELHMDVIRRLRDVPRAIAEQHSINESVNALTLSLQDHCVREGLPFTSKSLDLWIRCAADKRRVNPVRNYLEEQARRYQIKPKQRGETIGELFNCLMFEDDVTKKQKTRYANYFSMWLLQCVAMAHNEYARNNSEFILTLQSIEQGIGKTRFFRHLCSPPELSIYFLEGQKLNPDNKDDVLETTSCWICELGELETTTKKADAGKLKQFLLKPSDKVRAPYDPAASTYPRFTSYCATVNESDFLTEAGRRFVVIPIIDIDTERMLKVDINRLWAEVYEGFKENPNGFRLDKDELNNVIQESNNFRTVYTEEQALLDSLNWDAPAGEWQEMTATELARDLDQKDVMKVGKSLAKLGYIKTSDDNIQKRFRISGGVKRYNIPPYVHSVQNRMKGDKVPLGYE